jgi:DNA-binding protein Fis
MIMKKTLYTAALAMVLCVSPAFAADQEFDAEKMLSELEQKLELSGDALAKLKPAIDAKSAELKTSINQSLEQGFMELGALSQQLDAASMEAQTKLKEALSSDEMKQLKEYLSKIDGDAIASIRDQLVVEVEKFLKLTEGQVAKLKPVLEDAFNQLGEMLDRLAQQGTRSLETFKKEYEGLNLELKQKLAETLDGEQLKSLEVHRDELRENINKALFSE